MSDSKVTEGQRDKTENKRANDHFERLRKFRSMTAKHRIGTKKTHAKAQRTKISQKITNDTKTDTLKKRKRARFGGQKIYGSRNYGISLESLFPPVKDSIFVSFVILCDDFVLC